MKVEFSLSKIKCILLSLPCVIFCIILNFVFVPKLIDGIKVQNTQEILFCLFMIFIFLILGAFGILIALQLKNQITLNDDCIEGYYNGKIKVYYK
ncbi:MAG: hypothetical protein IKA02_06355, partial [Clostridia bacterium]|nr:hypothetical protein [Clostridia bacterium]